MSNHGKIAVMGGSFDPVHLGHVQLAINAKNSLNLDKVIFLPCQQSPHKNIKPSATSDQRIEMLQLATSDYEWIEVSQLETQLPPPSYSILSARHFKTKYPNSELFWIIGNDQWKKIESWNQIDKLGKIVNFIVFPRDGEEPKLNPDFKSHFIDYNFNASSTEVRNSVKINQKVDLPIDQNVLKYINENSLYSC